MKKVSLMLLMLSLPASFARAHCQVPCGVYTDEMRFTMIEEDFQTIEKAMSEIQRLAASSNAADVAKVIRWTNTKEEHAQKVQRVVCDYFMTQRVKPESDKYIEKVTTLHRMLLAAMKCRQSLDPAEVVSARKLTAVFHELYFPKTAADPVADAHDHSAVDHAH